MYKKYLTCHRTLKRITLTVREYFRHHRDSSPVNDLLRDRNISVMTPVHSRRSFVIEPQTSMSYSLCFCDTYNIRDLIVGITIPSSISLPTLSFTRSVIFHPRDLVTCCNIGWNLTEWAPSIFSSRRKTNPALCIRLNILHWNTRRHLFSHQLRNGVWCHQRIRWKKWLDMISRSKDLCYNVSYHRNITSSHDHVT
jgi:hypothetical protein